MTLKYNLESLYMSEFSASELSLLKLLVLTTLREYDDLNVNEASGSIYAKLKQIPVSYTHLTLPTTPYV